MGGSPEMALDLHKHHWGGDRDTPAAAEEKTWFGWRIVGPDKSPKAMFLEGKEAS